MVERCGKSLAKTRREIALLKIEMSLKKYRYRSWIIYCFQGQTGQLDHAAKIAQAAIFFYKKIQRSVHGRYFGSITEHEHYIMFKPQASEP